MTVPEYDEVGWPLLQQISDERRRPVSRHSHMNDQKSSWPYFKKFHLGEPGPRQMSIHIARNGGQRRDGLQLDHHVFRSQIPRMKDMVDFMKNFKYLRVKVSVGI